MICIKHFETKFSFPENGKRRKRKWNIHPILTTHSKAALDKQSILPTPSTSRNPPRPTVFHEDETSKFIKIDTMSNFEELNSSHIVQRDLLLTNQKIRYWVTILLQFVLQYYNLYDKDVALQENVRKASKLTYSALHPGNNKQNVPLPLAIFDETTNAAFKSFFLVRKNVANFLTLINPWWTVVNVRAQFTLNVLANVPVQVDGKADFLFFFANWLEKWTRTSGNTFSFSKQTNDALVRTLHAQSCLITDLQEKIFIFAQYC